jgi:hypothetical protein
MVGKKQKTKTKDKRQKKDKNKRQKQKIKDAPYGRQNKSAIQAQFMLAQ